MGSADALWLHAANDIFLNAELAEQTRQFKIKFSGNLEDNGNLRDNVKIGNVAKTLPSAESGMSAGVKVYYSGKRLQGVPPKQWPVGCY